MKTLNNYINENLNNTDSRNLDSIIKANNVDVDKPFFFMTRIPKKKEFHIYQCKGREQLEQYYENTLKKPLEFGRYSLINNDKEELLKKTKLLTFKKEHYKIIEEQ